jgi:hypothetical protein
MIALNDQINAAREVTKTHTSNVETFKSGDFGFLGVVDFDRVIFARAPLRRQHIALNSDSMPYVEIVAMYGGADGRPGRTRARTQEPDRRHLARLLRPRRERPHHRRAAKCGQQFPPSDGDCHAPLPCEGA